MTKTMDMHKRWVAHIEASRKRDEWARKGLEYSKAGKAGGGAPGAEASGGVGFRAAEVGA